MIPLSYFQQTLLVRQFPAASLVSPQQLNHGPESLETIYILCFFQPYSFYLLLIFYQQWFGLCVDDQG